MSASFTTFQSLPQPNDRDDITRIKKFVRNKRSLTNGSVLQIFRSHRDNLAQRLKKGSKTNNNHVVVPPQPLLPACNKSSPDMTSIKHDIDEISDQCKGSLASSTSPDRSLQSGGTAALSFSSDDSSPIMSKIKKTYDAPPVNIYADAEHDIGGDDSENDWVDFPAQSFIVSSEEQVIIEDFGSIIASTMLGVGDDISDNDDDAKKCLFGDVKVDWDGFIDEFPTSSSMIETLQSEIKELKEELTLTQKRLETANTTNEALNEAHDQKHKELEQLNQDMDRFSDVIMLCMQKLRERNVALESENDDMKQRVNVLTRCTEALNDAHDRKNEEYDELKKDIDKFATTVAEQHDNMQVLEGRLRDAISENEELKSSLSRARAKTKSSRRKKKKLDRIDETSDDEDGTV